MRGDVICFTLAVQKMFQKKCMISIFSGISPLDRNQRVSTRPPRFFFFTKEKKQGKKRKERETVQVITFTLGAQPKEKRTE